MATRSYYVSRGKTQAGSNNVTEGVGSAVTGGLVEVVVDLAVTASKKDVLEGLETISRYIRKGNWPPA